MMLTKRSWPSILNKLSKSTAPYNDIQQHESSSAFLWPDFSKPEYKFRNRMGIKKQDVFRIIHNFSSHSIYRRDWLFLCMKANLVFEQNTNHLNEQCGRRERWSGCLKRGKKNEKVVDKVFKTLYYIITANVTYELSNERTSAWEQKEFSNKWK